MSPAWSRDARELFCRSPDDQLMSVPVPVGDGFVPGQAKQVLADRYVTNATERQHDFLTAAPVP